MADAYMIKTPRGALVPADAESAEALAKVKVGQGVKVTYTRTRNIKFHRKFFALLKLAYDAWNPPPLMYRDQPVKTTFDQFRRQLTILAGYYEVEQSIDNPDKFKLVAKPISFAKMSQDEFERLYNAVLDVLLDRVFLDQARGDVENLVNNILAYD